MTARSGPPSAKGDRRGTQRHIPVLLPEVLDALAPLGGGTFIDGTFGAGGYTQRHPVRRANGARSRHRPRSHGHRGGTEPCRRSRRTPDARRRHVRRAGPHRNRGRASRRWTASCSTSASPRCSSTSPSAASRSRATGRSTCAWARTGPPPPTSSTRKTNSDLADIFFHLGEERRSRAVARAIVARRSEKPFTRTSELAELAERVLGRQKIAGRHAATRIFQALRIYVNDELGELVQGLAAAERVLKPGGRLAVVTFHSLEDGIVKRFLQAARRQPNGRARAICPLANHRSSRRASRSPHQRPITAREEELAANPRARSAKLRLATRTEAQPWPADDTDPAIPRL